MTDQALAVRSNGAVSRFEGFDNSKIALIKRTVAKDATNDELELFLHQARKTGLDPLAKQIYFIKRQGKGSIQTGIDGYRLVADRSGKYAGNDDAVFEGEDSNHPLKAFVTVYKMVDGQRCPFSATARWDEYVPEGGQAFMWRKMPYLMLGKVAEALALRKAFPAELSGVYTDSEMDQAGAVDGRLNVDTGEVVNDDIQEFYEEPARVIEPHGTANYAPAPHSGDSASEKQVNAIYSMLKHKHGFTPSECDDYTRQQWGGRIPMELTRTEASQFISSLQQDK